MKTQKPDIMINPDVYDIFIQELNKLYQNVENPARKLLKELLLIIQQNNTSIEPFYFQLRQFQKNTTLDPLTAGVIYFFIAKFYAFRKDFGVSLTLFEQAEQYLEISKTPDLAKIIHKDLYVLKMAFHHTDN